MIFSFFFFCPQKHVGTHKKCLHEALLMCTHNICFRGGIRKIFCGYQLLSGAMFLEVVMNLHDDFYSRVN